MSTCANALHHGIGTPDCPKHLHHHHDSKCERKAMTTYNGVEVVCNLADCRSAAKWVVAYGPTYMEYAHVCDEHTAVFLSPDRESTVLPISMDDTMDPPSITGGSEAAPKELLPEVERWDWHMHLDYGMTLFGFLDPAEDDHHQHYKLEPTADPFTATPEVGTEVLDEQQRTDLLESAVVDLFHAIAPQELKGGAPVFDNRITGTDVNRLRVWRP